MESRLASRMVTVKIADYNGREQAFVKHRLLGNYLPKWGYKTGSQWDTLVYVDGFAGPWGVQSEDFSDSSFGIAVNALREMRAGQRVHDRDINVRCVLVEKSNAAFLKLNQFAKNSHEPPGFQVHALKGQFIKMVPQIQELIDGAKSNPFKFVFLDPKGWSDIPMPQLAPFLRNRSCEVLINLMTSHMNRFYELKGRKESYDGCFGRREALEKLLATPKEDRRDVALVEYCESLKRLCAFEYVSSAVILSPDAEQVKYFLVFGTNHVEGVKVFKEAEKEAAKIQNAIRCQTIRKRGNQGELNLEQLPLKTKLAYDLHEKYSSQVSRRVIERLIASSPTEGVPYKTLFSEAMEFPLVTPEDLEQLVQEEPAMRLQLEQLEGSGKRRKPKPECDDRVFVADKTALKKRLDVESRQIQTSLDGILG
jgi:three-Cys-motif partner protein